MSSPAPAPARQSAIKRLRSDLEQLNREPIVGAAAEPYESDFFTWFGLVVSPPGTKYAGVPIRFVLEFGQDYPNTAPKGYFETDVQYHGGATERIGNRISICLDLFANYATYHSEWKTSSSGWSPSYTVHTILLNMLLLMQSEMISQADQDVASAAASAKRFTCAITGHKGADPSQWVPEVMRTNEELVAYLRGMRRAVTLAAATTTSSSSSSEVVVALPPGKDPLRDHYICYVSGVSLRAQEDMQLGYGVHVVNARSGMLTSPFEYLSLEAFESGTRGSSTNMPFEFWLPICVSSKLWNAELFAERIQSIAAAIGLPVQLPLEAKVLKVCASLMNSALVDLMKNAAEDANATANDKFIHGFFALYRIMMQQAGKLSELANSQLRPFTEEPAKRVKSACPNLGELLVAMSISDRYTWADIARAYTDESDTRNVFWYAVGNSNSPASLPRLLANPQLLEGRASAVFGQTATSRNLLLFQVRFFAAARSLSVADFDAHLGLAPEPMRLQLKQTYKEATAVADWPAYNDWLGIPRVTEAVRNQQLVDAMARSKAQGYHGGGGGGGGRGGGNGGRRGSGHR